jgi:hypothetical protein
MSASILMLIARIALAVCLYGFLSLVLFSLWRDLRSARNPLPGSSAQVRLRWLRPDGAPLRDFPLPKESCVIGRSPTAEIPLADDTVSVVHARVWQKGGRWWLEDLDSRNGTFLNEIPIEKRTVLCPGDRIRLGRCVLEFQPECDPPPSTAPLANNSNLPTEPRP